MRQPIEYRFAIDVFTLDTLPMARLAEYLAELAQLLGNVDSVHFDHVEDGSAVLVQRIEAHAVPKVRDRLESIASTVSSREDVQQAYSNINQMLERDNAVGVITDEKQAEIIRFPGRETPQPDVFGPIRQSGSLYGELVSVGGIDKTVPVRLRDLDNIWRCNTSPDVAREIAHHLLGPTLKVDGVGRWVREADGLWSLRYFSITGFEVLPDLPLGDVVNDLRRVEGSGWKDFDEPFESLRKVRSG